MQPLLGSPRDFADAGVLTVLAPPQLAAELWRACVVMSRLDQQAPGMLGARLGDPALATPLVGGPLGRGDAQMAGEQLRLAKAREVADLSADSRRRERVDASKAAEARDQLGIGALGHQLADRSIEHSASLREAVDGDQVVDEARLGREI